MGPLRQIDNAANKSKSCSYRNSSQRIAAIAVRAEQIIGFSEKDSLLQCPAFGDCATLALALSDIVAACFISLVLGMALTPFSVQRGSGSLRSNSSSFFQLFFVLGMLGV